MCATSTRWNALYFLHFEKRHTIDAILLLSPMENVVVVVVVDAADGYYCCGYGTMDQMMTSEFVDQSSGSSIHDEHTVWPVPKQTSFATRFQYPSRLH